MTRIFHGYKYFGELVKFEPFKLQLQLIRFLDRVVSTLDNLNSLYLAFPLDLEFLVARNFHYERLNLWTVQYTEIFDWLNVDITKVYAV